LGTCTCCIESVSATATPKVTVQKSRSVWRRARLCRVDCALQHRGDRVPTSPRHVGLGALHLGNQGNRHAPSCLHLTTTLPSIVHHPSYNGCTYPPRMPASPRRSARSNPAPCFSYRHLDSLKASTARCTSDRSINFSHARLPDGHTSFSTCLSSLEAQPPFGYLRPMPYTHLTSSRRLSTM
jgi:hypothetical protein